MESSGEQPNRRDDQALAAAAEADDRERLQVLEALYQELEAELERDLDAPLGGAPA